MSFYGMSSMANELLKLLIESNGTNGKVVVIDPKSEMREMKRRAEGECNVNTENKEAGSYSL